MSNLLEGVQSVTRKEIIDFLTDPRKPFTDKTPIPITYLISALYPDAYKNLQKNFSDNYMKGYIQGKEDAEGGRENDKESN